MGITLFLLEMKVQQLPQPHTREGGCCHKFTKLAVSNAMARLAWYFRAVHSEASDILSTMNASISRILAFWSGEFPAIRENPRRATTKQRWVLGVWRDLEYSRDPVTKSPRSLFSRRYRFLVVDSLKSWGNFRSSDYRWAFVETLRRYLFSSW
jgi:hypothetical protein